MKRHIKKVAVLGSGVMGSRIACHFANVGIEVLLLDIPPTTCLPEEEAKGLNLASPSVRNRIVKQSLETTLKSNPSPIFSKRYLDRIHTGNFEDDMPKIAQCDWVIEVVVERLAIKKSIFQQVEHYRRPGSLVTSNTSGIPIHLMAEDRSDDFKAHFCGTHFFNPPRYLDLLEIIPTAHTATEITDFLLSFGDKILGKSTVLCKDTPAFIGNRIGVYSVMSLFHLAEQLGLTVGELDQYTGPAMGHPKSATFRTADVVGLDTLASVAQGLQQNAPEDEAKGIFELPAYVKHMLDKKWLGAKTAQGFYKKVKNEKGESAILSLDLQTLTYQVQTAVNSDTLTSLKSIEKLSDSLKAYAAGTDKAGILFRAMHYALFEYVSHRVPEITEDFYRIDEAMRAGFGWELGPFEIWDALGVEKSISKISEEEKRLPGQRGQVASWVEEMLAAGCISFYKVENGKRQYYHIPSKSYKPIPGTEDDIRLDHIRTTQTLWQNARVSIINLGDGIINCEFHTKMNSIDADVLQGIHKAIDLAEKEYRGLVISNEGKNFSAGANLGMIFTLASAQNWEKLVEAVHAFQQTSMRIRYSAIPVVVAPFQLTLGGGCEFAMHADFVQLHAETYMGLVEFGVGVIPGGGGTKEFTLRASDAFRVDQIAQNTLKDRFLTIGQAKVSTSAVEAAELGYLQEGKYAVTMNRNRLLSDAKNKARELADAGYVQPLPRSDIKVLGKQGLGTIYVGAASMHEAKYITAYDQQISEQLGWVMCGGDLSTPTEVSEQYLLDLERKAFVELCAQPQTLQRIQHMLTKGKPLRN